MTIPNQRGLFNKNNKRRRGGRAAAAYNVRASAVRGYYTLSHADWINYERAGGSFTCVELHLASKKCIRRRRKHDINVAGCVAGYNGSFFAFVLLFASLSLLHFLILFFFPMVWRGKCRLAAKHKGRALCRRLGSQQAVLFTRSAVAAPRACQLIAGATATIFFSSFPLSLSRRRLLGSGSAAVYSPTGPAMPFEWPAHSSGIPVRICSP